MRSKETGDESAIKYSMKYNSQRDRYEKFREVVFLEFINHPNCIKFKSAWEEADTLFIETELCLCNLQKYIFKRDGDVPEMIVWNVLLDVLRVCSFTQGYQNSFDLGFGLSSRKLDIAFGHQTRKHLAHC